MGCVRAQHPDISNRRWCCSCARSVPWEQLFPEERRRIVQLLIERVTLGDAGIEITWQRGGWPTLAGEMRPAPIGGGIAGTGTAGEWCYEDHSKRCGSPNWPTKRK